MKKVTTAKLNKQVWEQCKRIIKIRYGDTCYTCGRHCEGSGRHTGHFLPKSTLPLEYKYDLKMLRPQCYRCNVHLSGNSAEYLLRWLEETKTSFEDYQKMIAKIKQTPSMGLIQSWMFLFNLLEEYKKL